MLTISHLFIACLKERTGVIGEIHLKCDLELDALKTVAEAMDESDENPVHSAYFNTVITEVVAMLMEDAINYMTRRNQIYVNEGHLLKALIKTEVMSSFLTKEQRDLISALGTGPRDMITHLVNYTYPDIAMDACNIRKVNEVDFNELVIFVEQNFSIAWSKTVRNAFQYSDPSIYIAVDHEGEIIGFAGFDIYKQKKCYFGPMGVSKTNRIKGVGCSLLHHCLRDMKGIGYEYAVIAEAGPIAFYEKTCNAVVIPFV